MLEDADRRLIRMWQSDPSLSVSELSDQLGQTPTKTARRIDHLTQQGVIEGLGHEVDWAKLGYSAEVSLRVTLDKTQSRAFDDFIAAARKVPEVIEIQTFLGRVDVRLSVIARDMAHYQQLYRTSILTLPHIADIEALMQVAVVKSDVGLPL
ncbi:Lrp/AsnC family transcriptional regulator [Algirhabdus cladophorae]|uniref:Lrp/AsnC family transcriptional regulator n=1 Tax=Algirhabdus cladophorae TaxID=3377108 RepID=UPI003B84831E